MTNIGKKFDIPELDLTTNQKKVFLDKYQKEGDPTAASVLIRVAHNIALAELLYHTKFHETIFRDVAHKKEEIEGGNVFYLHNKEQLIELSKKKKVLKIE